MNDSAFHENDLFSSSDNDIATEFLTPVGTPSKSPETILPSEGIHIFLSRITQILLPT